LYSMLGVHAPKFGAHVDTSYKINRKCVLKNTPTNNISLLMATKPTIYEIIWRFGGTTNKVIGQLT